MAQLTGGCAFVDAGTDGREVDLVGEVTGRDRDDATGGGATGGASKPDQDGEGGSTAEPVVAEPAEDPLRWDWTATDPPEITLSDLASFVPAAGATAGEPAGWGIVGLDTNFYAEAGVQVVEGELLGLPAAVRFTPVAWHWSYGDGSGVSTSTPGAPWGSVEDEFQPTPTSHRYAEVGTFRVGLTVEFGAEFRFAGGDWLPVAGTVTANAEPLSVRIGTADTVLVEHGCGADSAPGC